MEVFSSGQCIFTRLMKLYRNSKGKWRIFINYVLGPALFAWLSWSIYREVQRQPDLAAAWIKVKSALGSSRIFLLLAVVFLAGMNWALEAIKWQLAVKEVQPVSFSRAFRAVLSGVSFSVSTPNRVGEYLGRVLYMDEGNRLRTIAVTMVSSLSQLLITLFMGLIGLLFLKQDIVSSQLISAFWLLGLIWAVTAVFLLLLLFYFRLGWLIRITEKISFFNRYRYLVEAVGKTETPVLVRMLLLSAGRYAVFLLQYFLLYQFFEVRIDALTVCWTVSVGFLLMAAIPTVAIAELGIKGKVALLVTGIYSANKAGIIFATAGIWFINLVIPAVAGSLLILGLRRFFKTPDPV